jgi:hypothetical protein
MVSFPQASPPKPCANLSPPPYAPHAQPISSQLILKSEFLKNKKNMHVWLHAFISDPQHTTVRFMPYCNSFRSKIKIPPISHTCSIACPSYVYRLNRINISQETNIINNQPAKTCFIYTASKRLPTKANKT